jgi:hypothetical protein
MAVMRQPVQLLDPYPACIAETMPQLGRRTAPIFVRTRVTDYRTRRPKIIFVGEDFS